MALPPEYQRSLVAAIAELRRRPEFVVEKHLAEAIGYSPAALNRVTLEDGGSMRMLERLARLLGKQSAEELVREFEGAEARLRELPKFEESLAEARQQVDHPDDVWIRVGNMFAVGDQRELTPHMLVKAAEFVIATTNTPGKTSRVKKRPR